jgi:hypothetical protein
MSSMVPLVQRRRPRIATFATSLNNRTATEVFSTMGQKVQLTDTAAHEFENSEANHRRPVIRTPLDDESRSFWTEMAKNGTSWTILPIERMLDRCCDNLTRENLLR